MREPLLMPLGALALGIFVSRVTEFELAEIIGAECALAVLYGLAQWRGLRLAATASALTATALFGALLTILHDPGAPPTIDASPYETVVISGCVAEPATFDGDRSRLVAELDPAALALVRVYYDEGDEPLSLAYGQRIDITGRVRIPSNFRNEGSFDYRRYLARQQIHWTISVSSPDGIEVLEGECGSWLWAAIQNARSSAISRVASLYADRPEQEAMLQAILLGNAVELEEHWKDSFRRTGAYHTLIISGLHLTVLAGVLHLLLRLFQLPLGGRIVVTITTAWFYAFLTGCNTPVLRAAAGLTLYLCASWFFRRRRLINILAAIAIAFLIASPDQLFDASFHLSFLAVAMIGAVAIPLLEATCEPYRRGLRGLAETDRDLHLAPEVAQFRVELRLLVETVNLWTRIPMKVLLAGLSVALRFVFYVAELTVMSAVIQIGLALPMVAYFHRFSFAGLIANPLVVPLVSLAVPLGFLAILTGWVLPTAIAGRLVAWALGVVQSLAGWGAESRVPPPPEWLGVLFVLSLVGAAISLRHAGQWRFIGTIPPVAVLAVIVIHPFAPQVTPGALELTAIDVGQAESLLLTLPAGQAIVVDGGGIPSYGNRKAVLDLGENVVSPYLWSRSIRRLDVLVNTHAHEDHVSGLFALVASFRPREVWLSDSAGDPAALALAEHAREHGAKVIRLAAGDSFRYGGVGFDVLWPPPAESLSAETSNDASLVLRITHGRHRFLLTGDIETQTESRIAARIGPIDVLKVAHHGSETSSTVQFLETARPAFALVSAGLHNPFRFPHEGVVKRLARHRSAVFSTNWHGRVSVRSDGRRITVDAEEWPVPRGE